MAQNRPNKPSVTLPDNFGGVKNEFSSTRISNGYEASTPEIVEGGNLNYMLDGLFRNTKYMRTVLDYVRDTPVGKMFWVNSSGQMDYIQPAIIATNVEFDTGTATDKTPNVKQVVDKLATKANNDSVVHLTGSETIGGVKSFTADPYIYNGNPTIYHRQPNFNKGDIPQTNIISNDTFVDDTGYTQSSYVLASYGSTIFTDGCTRAHITAYRNVAGSTDNASIFVSYPIDGSPYTYAPTPTDTTSTSSHQIVTVGWVNSANNNVVHKTGQETINNEKTFTANLTRAHTDITKGTNPSSDIWWGLEFTDKNGPTNVNRLGLLETGLHTNGDVETYIAAYLNTNGSRDQTALKIVYTKDGNKYAIAPASDVIDSIVTTKAIRKTAQSGDNASWAIKLGNGFIIQGGSIESNISTVTLAIPFTKESYQVSMVQADDSEHNINPTLSDKTVTNFKCGHHGWRVSWIAAGF